MNKKETTFLRSDVCKLFKVGGKPNGTYTSVEFKEIQTKSELKDE